MNNTQGIPRIGLLPYSRADGSQYFPQDYLDAIEMVGAEMVPVMHDTPLDTLYPLVISMDAMIFSGGCDIDPVHYGCSRESGCGRIDPRRDQTELALFDLVFGRNIPVLGICRGIQLINVALSGTLKQDISGPTSAWSRALAWPRLPERRPRASTATTIRCSTAWLTAWSSPPARPTARSRPWRCRGNASLWACSGTRRSP